MVIDGIISLLLLFKTRVLCLFAVLYSHSSINLVQFMCNFIIDSKVLWIVLYSFYIFLWFLFFCLNMNLFFWFCWYGIQRSLLHIIDFGWFILVFLTKKLVIDLLSMLFWLILSLIHFILFINYKWMKRKWFKMKIWKSFISENMSFY